MSLQLASAFFPTLLFRLDLFPCYADPVLVLLDPRLPFVLRLTAFGLELRKLLLE